jgi:chaperonin GroEL
LASLTGGIAVIRVGGATESEIREKKDRIQNAMHVTRAAIEEGILPGGGVALLRASKLAGNLNTENDDQKAGIAIVREAITWPARQIAANAGADGSVVVAKILDTNDNRFGFDAQACEFGDLIARGIIDPAKVVRSALQGAASIAGLLITTEAMVAEVPGPPPPELPGHHDHEDHLDMEF